MKKISLLILCLFVMLSCDYDSKDYKHNRDYKKKVTLYDNNGNVIKTWIGNFEVGGGYNHIRFTTNGKRVTIYGGTIIEEEL